MPLSAYAEKAALDWMLLGATPTRPSQLWVGLSFGTPNSTSGSEVAATNGYTRVTVTMAAAASPAGTASNAAAIIFAAATYASTVKGWQLWNTQGVGAGTMLLCGLMATATLPGSASQFTCATGGFIVNPA